MSIERKCRLICTTNRIDPDADAPDIFQKIPGFKRAPDGKVKNWMVWVTTIEARIIRERREAKKQRDLGKR